MTFSFSSGTCSGQMNCLQVGAQNPPGNEQRIMCKHWLSTRMCTKGKKGKNTHPIPFFNFIYFFPSPLILLPLCAALEGCWWEMETFINSLLQESKQWSPSLGIRSLLWAVPEESPCPAWWALSTADPFRSFSKASFRLLHKKKKNLRVLSRWRDFNPFKLLQFYSSCLI